MRPVGARRQAGTRGDAQLRGHSPREAASPGPAPLDPGHCLASASQQGGIAAGPGAPTGCPVHYPPGPGTTRSSLQCQTPACQLSWVPSFHRVGQQPTPAPRATGEGQPPAEPLQPGLTHHVQDTWWLR